MNTDLVNASTILPSITTYIPPPTLLTRIEPVLFGSLFAFSAPSTPALGIESTPAITYIMDLSSVMNPLVAMTTTSNSYSREMLDLAKIYTNEIKHSGQNDTPMFELTKL